MVIKLFNMRNILTIMCGGQPHREKVILVYVPGPNESSKLCHLNLSFIIKVNWETCWWYVYASVFLCRHCIRRCEEQPNRLFVWAAVGVWSHDALPKLGSRIRRRHTHAGYDAYWTKVFRPLSYFILKVDFMRVRRQCDHEDQTNVITTLLGVTKPLSNQKTKKFYHGIRIYRGGFQNIVVSDLKFHIMSHYWQSIAHPSIINQFIERLLMIKVVTSGAGSGTSTLSNALTGCRKIKETSSTSLN